MQLEYYNARDLEKFMSLMAKDVKVTNVFTGDVIAMSAEELRPRYEARFKTPVHCEVISRTCLGSIVVDREVITGLPDNGVADCLAIYKVNSGKIVGIQLGWHPRS